MGNHTTFQARVAWRGGFIALGMLAFAHCAAAVENSPLMPPEKEAAAWQRAGLEAALADPDFVVQYHALDCCVRKKWVAQLHFPTAQWLLWLGHSNQEVRELAARAAAQLGAQMPPEVQHALARLQQDKDAGSPAQRAATLALGGLGSGMTPEVQMEMAAFLQSADVDIEQRMDACKALGSLGSSMAPATLKTLLSLMKNPQAAGGADGYAADALARLGVHMPPQVRELMLSTLLEARADICAAAEAMGRLGPQMPPQARQLLLSVLRDPHAGQGLRYVTPAALAQLGPQMPPEVQQALLAVYDEPPPAKADEDTRTSHIVFHQQVVLALGLAGPDMPPAMQQGLLDRFLKAARAPQTAPPPAGGFTAMVESGILGEELLILAKAGAQVSPAVLRAVLAEFQSPATSDAARESIAVHFLQPLAERGALPEEVQGALLACVQDAKARPELRGQAALALGHLGALASAEIRQALLTLLQDPSADSALRSSAVEAMVALGSHMPPEAAPTLVRMVQAALAKEAAAPAPTGPDPFAPSASPPAGAASGAPAKPALTPYRYEPDLVEFAVPALGNLGEKMTPETQTALLGVITHPVGNATTPWDAAYALAQMGDKLPAQVQQRLLALLHAPGMEYELRLAIYQTLGVSGIHPVTDAQVADLLARTYEGEPDAELRFYLHLWLGRSPAHLQAVRWLGHQAENPPLGETTPQEVLALVARFWPHSAGTDAAHSALRQGLARRTSQMLTTHLKSPPLDEATQKVLRTLAAQLAEDPAAECVTALGQVQAALAAEKKAR